MKRVLAALAAVVLAAAIPAAPAEAGQTFTQHMGTANYKEVKGSVYSWAGFPAPCTVPTSALILLEKQGPANVLIGDTFSYFIQISNRSEQDMISVTLEDAVPEGFEVQSIEPQPTKVDGNGKLYWDVGGIPARTAKRITLTGRAMKLGCLASASLARICYEIPLPLAVRVLQCNVGVRQTLPPVVDACDPIEMVITAANLGTAPATNVGITGQLPEGLTTEDGQSSIVIPVGQIPVGEQRNFSVKLKAARPGDYDTLVTITGDRNCVSQSAASMRVVSADLELTASAPADGFICTSIPYTIQITNRGNGIARDVKVMQKITGGFDVANVSEGGKTKNNRTIWTVCDLAPGESRTVRLQGSGAKEGNVCSEFSVAARCLPTKKASHVLGLRGVAGVLTGVKDDCDPVQVGGVTTYTITASNTGSRDDHDVRYLVELDEGMEYLSGSGATEVTAIGDGALSFAPLPVLAKGETATWRVSVRMTTPGDKRFTAKLVTAQLTNPVAKSESTTVYQPNMQMVVAQ